MSVWAIESCKDESCGSTTFFIANGVIRCESCEKTFGKAQKPKGGA